MARECTICGKKRKLVYRRKKLRGKYNPTAKRKQSPNLQRVRLADGKRVLACTRCIRTINKNRG